MVSKSPDSTTVPSDGPVERAMAALMPCVDVRRGCGASGLKAVRISIWTIRNMKKKNRSLCKIPQPNNTGTSHSQYSPSHSPTP